MSEEETNGVAPWVMPKVEPGMIVKWNWNSNAPGPSYGVVLDVGTSTINLSVHVSGMKDHVLKTGVRHKDDPFLMRFPQSESGVWELTDRDKKINELLKPVMQSLAGAGMPRTSAKV